MYIYEHFRQILLDLVENTILLLINMGAKATTCAVPKISIHLALLTINSNILKAVFEAGGSPTYTLSNEAERRNTPITLFKYHRNKEKIKGFWKKNFRYNLFEKSFCCTNEESQVCYECLQHQSKEMEACSSCYFALLCSESCKNQHNNENNCKLQMSKDYIINILNELNNNITDEKSKTSNISSTYLISTENSKINSEQLESNKYVSLSSVSRHSLKSLSLITDSLQSSNFSKISDNSFSEDTQRYTEDDSNQFMQSNQSKRSKQSKQSKNKVINRSHSKKYKKSDFEDGSNYSKTNKIDSSVSLQNTNSKVRIQSKRYRKDGDLDYDKNNFIHTDSVVKFDNKNKLNDRKSGRKNTRYRERKLILNNKVNIPVSSMKYRMVRSPGCWIPIFMFINRGSYEDVTILNNVISSGMSYILMIEKSVQVYSNINDNQYYVLNNYSLI
ncbi:putative uncharacterized protein DDB_G0282499 isoform X2 [Rhopalosiphum padi]|uniref:putative uncharacterized protein DDB_G0282499 isoform X2 n=1 Tax=Rhopalosiphum padi TaxID=40932 RepID=UPI00298E863E|nr:putative uncharacterized protein DDB_G0282499 isoform X2 [Rhopalosiphum padi]